MMIPLCGRRREVSEDVGGTVEDQETPVISPESQSHALDTQAARTPADAVAEHAEAIRRQHDDRLEHQDRSNPNHARRSAIDTASKR